jgi:hypothetical protein
VRQQVKIGPIHGPAAHRIAKIMLRIHDLFFQIRVIRQKAPLGVRLRLIQIKDLGNGRIKFPLVDHQRIIILAKAVPFQRQCMKNRRVWGFFISDVVMLINQRPRSQSTLGNSVI